MRIYEIIKLTGSGKEHNTGIDSFIVDFIEQTNANPINHRERIYNNQVTIELRPVGDRIHLSDIRSFAPHSGAGTTGLKFLTGLAKKHGVTIQAIAKAYHPDKKYIKSSDRLKDWYLKHGFRIEPDTFGDDEEGYNIEYVPESTTLSYIGNCTNDDVIEHLFGDATGFAQLVDEHGDEFIIDDLVVKYDPDSDIHSFYYKTNETDLEEGWREKVLGLAGAASIYAGLSNLPAPNTQANIEPPSQQTQVQKKPQLPFEPAIPKEPIITLKTNHPAERIILNAAKREGLAGKELAQFMAQCRHESWDFTKMKQVGDTKELAKKMFKVKSLGNRNLLDAEKFIGRGPIQISGRANYQKISKHLYNKFKNNPTALKKTLTKIYPNFLVDNPQLLLDPHIGAEASLDYWKNRVRPKIKDFGDTQEVTKYINSELRHLDRRHAHYLNYMGNQG